jgi:membrane protein implicated in regulation of membrane protease activity
MASRNRCPASTPAHPALRIAGSVARGIAVVVLSLVYYVTSAFLVGFGAACAWNGLGPGDSPYLDYPVTGVVMLVLGVSVFIFFPRVVKKLTGREVISTPYSW